MKNLWKININKIMRLISKKFKKRLAPMLKKLTFRKLLNQTENPINL